MFVKSLPEESTESESDEEKEPAKVFHRKLSKHNKTLVSRVCYIFFVYIEENLFTFRFDFPFFIYLIRFSLKKVI